MGVANRNDEPAPRICKPVKARVSEAPESGEGEEEEEDMEQNDESAESK